METGSIQPRGRGRGGRTAERTSGSISELRSTATRGAGWKRRLVTTIATITALAGPATADELVTNLGESSLGTTTELRLSVNDIVMPFTTGPNPTGYRG